MPVMTHIQFVLLDRSGDLVREWTKSFREFVPETVRQRFTMVTSKSTRLSDLEEEYKKFDCIVSPGNSYGRLDGGFDSVISETLSPNDLLAPTRLVQSALYSRWKGYIPPGSCMLVPLRSGKFSLPQNPHDCSFLALCPTMRVPESVQWNKEVVYNLMWSLLVALDEHNRKALSDSEANLIPERSPIHRVLMTGLGTGVGGISAERCAMQMALAVRDFTDAYADPVKWSFIEWDDAYRRAEEVRRTHEF